MFHSCQHMETVNSEATLQHLSICHRANLPLSFHLSKQDSEWLTAPQLT